MEFAISSTVLVLLFGGLLDLSHGMQISDVLYTAAREGARHGITYSQAGTNPYLDDADIKSAVDAQLTANGLPASSQLGGITAGGGCLAPTDGNGYNNPPYSASAYPTSSNQPWLYVCVTSGTPQDLEVVLLDTYGPLTQFLPANLPGGFEIAAFVHMKVQR